MPAEPITPDPLAPCWLPFGGYARPAPLPAGLFWRPRPGALWRPMCPAVWRHLMGQGYEGEYLEVEKAESAQ